jgi:hypothetical protein
LKVREKNEIEHKLYYKLYCKIVSEVTKEEKKLYYKDIIIKSKRKLKPLGISHKKKQVKN